MADKKTKLEDKIDQFLHECNNNVDNKKVTLELGKVTKAEAREAKKIGFNIYGFTKTITSSDVKHIKNRHGNASVERSRGQLPMTDQRIKDSIIKSRNPYKAEPLEGKNATVRYKLLSGSSEGEHSQINEVSKKKKVVNSVSGWLKKW